MRSLALSPLHRRRPPRPIALPHPGLAVIRGRIPGPQIRKPEILVLAGALPQPGEVVRAEIFVAPEALDVVDQDAQAEVVAGVGSVEGESDVLRESAEHGRGHVGDQAAEMAGVVELAGGLEQAGKVPAGDAVDEEAQQQALVNEARTRLHGGARKEEQGEDVVVDAEVLVRHGQQEEQRGAHDAVEAQVARQAALDAKGPRLAEGDAEDGEHDGDQGRDRAGLVAYVRGRQAGYGDPVKGVVVQRSDPCGAEPEDRFFELRSQPAEGVLHAVAVDDRGGEACGQKAAHGCGEEFPEVEHVGRVGDEGDVEEETDEERPKEDCRGRGEE